MNELQLVGYTADLQHLVLSDANGASRFRVPVDDDLVATVEEVVGLVKPGSSFLTPEPPPPPPPPPPPEPVGPEPGTGALAGAAALVRRERAGVEEATPAERGSKLPPREIQSLLRSGRSPKAVAKLAGTDLAWVERWLPPIEAERDQVLQAVFRSRVTKARLGPSKDPIGEAVRRNLAAKGVRPDEEVRWNAARRGGDDIWTVELRYRNRGRQQRAVWRYDPETGELEATNALATEVAWTRRRARSQGSAKKATGRKAAAKKSAAKKTTAKKSAKKAAAAKKATGKRTAAKKTAAKKSAKKSAKKAPARKAAGKKATAKKSAAKKATAKKATAKKTAGKKATAKKATAKKSAAKKPAKKGTAKKARR